MSGATLNLTNYTLTFDDEFNTFTSSPNGSAGWQTTFYFGGRSISSNGEQEFYSDPTVGVNPFSLQNGELTITAAPGNNSLGLAYNSGLITSEGDFAQTYGYFEMRAELPQGAGMWPAFWLLPADKSWPPEIDALEAFGATNANGEGGANQVHYGAITSNYVTGGGGGWTTIPGNINTGYHTYGVDWENDFITWYVDGRMTGQVATPSDMHKPMYMLANLAVGGGWAGNPAGETGQMQIDYIRAYSSDPMAHAVALQTISSPDHVDTTPYGVITTSGISVQPTTLTLHVAEDAWNGHAQFTVLVDGAQVGGTQTVTASHALGQIQDVVLTGTFGAGPHIIDVNFINDGWAGTAATDRNLYVESIDIDSQHILGGLAHNNAANGSAAIDPTAAVMTINGTAEFSSAALTIPATSASNVGGGNLHILVSEDAWSGDAAFTVTVDGKQVGDVQTTTASHALGQWQDIALTGTFSTGPHTVDVNFLNDGWGGSFSMDRNLYVGAININGETIAGYTATNNATAGYAAVDSNAAVMMTNGTAEFHSTGMPTTATSTVVLHVAEDSWNGDAQFTVSIDGNQVGGVQTATASHAQGQWQNITLNGDYGLTGPGHIDITFINDGYGGTSATDRNLYVQSIDVNSMNFAGNLASDNASSGSYSADLHAAVMMIDGTADFAINHTTTPNDIWHIA